jgi:hypothetical protein
MATEKLINWSNAIENTRIQSTTLLSKHIYTLMTSFDDGIMSN